MFFHEDLENQNGKKQQQQFNQFKQFCHKPIRETRRDAILFYFISYDVV